VSLYRRVVPVLLLGLLSPIESSGYDVPTHMKLGLRAANEASRLHEALIDDLGFPKGRETVFRNPSSAFTVAGWIESGAGEEDRPFLRVRHHFHDPLAAWDAAGLTIDAANPAVQIGMSSILRSQQVFQEGPKGGGTWSWPFARQRFLTALTARTPPERETALADTFRALGHVTHFIQDATVPAHTRNDMHLWVPLGGTRFYPLNSDWYEDWLQAAFDNRRTQFDQLLALPPKRPLRLVFHSEHPGAPIPIAGLIDTDQFSVQGRVPSLLGPHEFGIAELTHPNFVSRDTIFMFHVRPSLVDLGEPFVEARGDGTFRRYAPKVVRGAPTVEVIHFVAEAALAHSLAAVQDVAPPSVLWTLDERVHEDYARQLVPRAVGYSAELLDYFFRGRLAVDVVPDPVDPSVVRVIGTNESPESLFDGTLTLHADRTTGERGPAMALEPTSVIGVGPGEPVISARFRVPEDTERLVAVYEGTLGLERKRPDFKGAVIGKVLGGVRVEHVFADGPRWRLRTPTGVFDLPLSTDVYDDVKWGDADNVLVARTALRPDSPGVAATFEVVRRPESVEPMTDGTTPTVRLKPLESVPLGFAAGPLVTTIRLDETLDYRQRIGRWRQELATQWTTPLNAYTSASLARTPIVFETIHAQTLELAAALPIRLDADHNLDIGDADVPYVWDLVDVAADRDGRILGLAAIFLTAPGLAPIEVPWFGLDTAGQPFVARNLAFEARFPEDATTIWALVDLGAGTVIAATAAPVVTITSRRAEEGPPWDSGGVGEDQWPGVYRHAITTYAGGPLDGHVDELVDAPGFAPRASPGVSAGLDVVTGDQMLSVSGWFRPELRDALAGSGLGEFRAAEIQQTTRRWNYVCVTSSCAHDSDHAAFSVTTRRGGVVDAPAQLVDARRTRPAPADERLVLLADAFRADFRPIGSVVAWDAGAGRAREALRLPASFHGLGPTASTGAVLLSYVPRSGTPGTFYVPLEEGALESFFAGRDLTFDYALLSGDRLYGVQDLRFYLREPPLRPIPLPARLSAVPGDPVGDYHAIRVP
jgi:hypothetical protein